MAAIPTDQLSQNQKEELLCTYAALILHDDNLEVNAENINKLITASGNTVEPYMPRLFANALQSHDIGNLLSGVGTAAPAVGGGGGGGGGAAAGGGDGGGAAAKKEEPEEEEEEDDLGFSLFD